MGQKSSKPPRVDPRFFAPQKLYCYNEVDLRKLRRLIKDNKLAPCFPGEDSESQELEDCPICFLSYPSLNRAVCCHKPICTECFLQVKSQQAGSCPKCPYCKADFSIYFHGPLSAEEKRKLHAEEQQQAQAITRSHQCMQDSASPNVSRQESTILAEHGGPCSASILMAGHSMSNNAHSSQSLGSSLDAITPQAESIKAKPQWHNAAAAGSSASQADMDHLASENDASTIEGPAASSSSELQPQSSFSATQSDGRICITIHQQSQSPAVPACLPSTSAASPDQASCSTAQPARDSTRHRLAASMTNAFRRRSTPQSGHRKSTTLGMRNSSARRRTNPAAADSLAGFLEHQDRAGQLTADGLRPQPASGSHELTVGMVMTQYTFVPSAPSNAAQQSSHNSSLSTKPVSTAEEDSCHSATEQNSHSSKPSANQMSTAAEDSCQSATEQSSHSSNLSASSMSTAQGDSHHGASSCHGISSCHGASICSANDAINNLINTLETNARAAGNATEEADSTRSCTELSNESDLSNEADLSNGVDSSTRADLSNGAVLLQNPDGSLQYVVLTSDEQRAAEQRAAQQKRKQSNNGPSQQEQTSPHDQAVQAAIAAADARLQRLYGTEEGTDHPSCDRSSCPATEPRSRSEHLSSAHVDPLLQRMEETDARLRALYSSPQVL